MSRRDQIRMSDAEVLAFLRYERTVTCATVGPRGWPHLMPLWYIVRAPETEREVPDLWGWTYGSSQKIRNLERDPRATLQVEAGESYELLRGVMLETNVILHRETSQVAALGRELFARYGADKGEPSLTDLPPGVGEMVDAQATKRVVLQFVPTRWATWDHRKLAGTY